MHISRIEHPTYLSNSYVVSNGPETAGIVIDTGGPLDDVLRAIDDDQIRVEAILNTHDHHDHVACNADVQSRTGAELFTAADLDPGTTLHMAGMRVDILDTPGHCAPHRSLVVNGADLFSGDLIFAGSVGGTLGRGDAGVAELTASIMHIMRDLPHATRIHPGHCEPTTVGDELRTNPFVQHMVKRQETSYVAPPWSANVLACDEPAMVLVSAPDYDGGTKLWVQWASGTEAIVGGSRVTPIAGNSAAE
jgi:hydroxyacylglutathione hydrolase